MDQKERRDDVTLWVRIYACDLLGVEKTLKFGQHFTTELSSDPPLTGLQHVSRLVRRQQKIDTHRCRRRVPWPRDPPARCKRRKRMSRGYLSRFHLIGINGERERVHPLSTASSVCRWQPPSIREWHQILQHKRPTAVIPMPQYAHRYKGLDHNR